MRTSKQDQESIIRNIGASLLLADKMSIQVNAFTFGWQTRDSLTKRWINEDELPDDYPYDEMFPYSKVDIVRLFPPVEAIEWIRLGRPTPAELEGE